MNQGFLRGPFDPEPEPREPDILSLVLREVALRILRAVFVGVALYALAMLFVAVFLLWHGGAATVPTLFFFRAGAVSLGAALIAIIPEPFTLPIMSFVNRRKRRQAEMDRIEAEIRRDAVVEERRQRAQAFIARQDTERDAGRPMGKKWEPDYMAQRPECHGATSRDFDGLGENRPDSSRCPGTNGTQEKEAENPENDISERPATDTTPRRIYESKAEKTACEMFDNGDSLSAIARELFGNSNGRRISQVKELLAKHGLK